MILSFPNRKPRGIAIRGYPSVIWRVFFGFSSFSKSASELDLQDVCFSVADMFGYINSIRDEHVACSQNYVTVEPHPGNRVKAVESQHNFGVWSTLPLRNTGKLDPVDPSLFVHPLAFKLVKIEKRIGYSE